LLQLIRPARGFMSTFSHLNIHAKILCRSSFLMARGGIHSQGPFQSFQRYFTASSPESRVSLVNPSGGSCGRTDSLLGDDLFWPRFAPLRAALRHDVRPQGAVGLRAPHDERLDGVSDALCRPPPRLRDHGRFATAAPRTRRRLAELSSGAYGHLDFACLSSS
jgi:hypothetical protein